MYRNLGVLFYALVSVCSCVLSTHVRPRNVLPLNYIKETRPPTSNANQPVLVDFSMYVGDVNSINPADMDFRIDIFVRQKWTDPRLVIPEYLFEDGDDYVILPAEFFSQLWQPDTYFFNSKLVEVSRLSNKVAVVTIYRNKTISFTARMHAIVACQMEFRNYPLDVQICPLFIESFTYNNKKLRFRWADQAIMLNPELKLLQYQIDDPLRLEEDTNCFLDKEGNFSRLIVVFRFKRHIGHHIIQTFAPSTLIVVLSWFSFYLGLDAIPGRVTLLVTCMLTLVTMFSGLKNDLPPVAYVKALDVWMAGCMVFVFSALAEFVIVKVLDVQYRRLQQLIPQVLPVSEGKKSASNWKCFQPACCTRKSTGFFQLTWIDQRTGQKKILWEEIDQSSRIVFPVLFLLFLILYWPTLLIKTAK